MMFFAEPKSDTVSVIIPSALTRIAITACVAMTLLLGVFPGFLLDMTKTFAGFIS
jgi:NADH-quinone oxidoreductase subunit N